MSVINNIDRIPSIDEYINSHILVPFKRFDENYYDNNNVYVPVSNLYIPVSYVKEIIEDRYSVAYALFKKRYEEAYMKYDSPQADKYIYEEYKGHKDHNNTHVFFINVEDVDNTEILIEGLLRNLKNMELIYESKTYTDLIVPKFYVDYKSWRKVYDSIIERSSALDFKGEINIYDPDYFFRTADETRIIKVIASPNGLFNANGEVDDDILD